MCIRDRAKEALRQKLCFIADAVMVTVDGAPVAPVSTPEEVGQVVEQVCRAFESENEQVELVDVEPVSYTHL